MTSLTAPARPAPVPRDGGQGLPSDLLPGLLCSGLLRSGLLLSGLGPRLMAAAGLAAALAAGYALVVGG